MIYFKIILVVLVFQFPNLLKAQDLINSSEVEEKQLTEDILITVLRNNSFVKNKCYLFYDIRENNSKYKKTIENKIIRCLPFAITETNDSNFLSIKNKISAGIDTNFLYISMDFEKKQIDSSLLVLSQILYNKGIENAKNIATNNQNSVEFNRLKKTAFEILYDKNSPILSRFLQPENDFTNQELEKYYQNYFIKSTKQLVVFTSLPTDSVLFYVTKYFNQKQKVLKADVLKNNSKISKSQVHFYVNNSSENIFLLQIFPKIEISTNSNLSKISENLVGNETHGILKKVLENNKSKIFHLKLDNILIKNNEFSIVNSYVAFNEFYNSIDKINKSFKDFIDSTIFEPELELSKQDLLQNIQKSKKETESTAKFIFSQKSNNQPISNYENDIKEITVDDIKNYIKKEYKYEPFYVFAEGKIIPENDLLKLAENAEIFIYEEDRETPTRKIPYGFCAKTMQNQFLETVKANKVPENQKIEVKGIFHFGEKTLETKQTIFRKNDKYICEENLIIDSTKQMLVKKVIINNNISKIIENQDTTIFKRDIPEIVILSNAQFAEISYSLLKLNSKLLGIVEGTDNKLYQVKTELNDKTQIFDYYDVVSGLKTKTEEFIVDSDSLILKKTVEYFDYNEISKNGMKLAYKKNIITKDYSAEFEITNYESSIKLDEKIFKIMK